MMPQRDIYKNVEFSTQKWLQRSPMVKSKVALYQKINVTRSTIYVENFILVSETGQGWYYATLLVNV